MGRYIGSSVELQGMKLVIGPIQREARGATGDETSGWADEQGRRPVKRLAHLWSKPGAKRSVCGRVGTRNKKARAPEGRHKNVGRR